MASRRTIFRMIAIQRVLVKYGLDDVIKETHLFRPLRFLFYLAPRRRDSTAPLGERIRLALEELGFFSREVTILGVYPASPTRVQVRGS